MVRAWLYFGNSFPLLFRTVVGGRDGTLTTNLSHNAVFSHAVELDVAALFNRATSRVKTSTRIARIVVARALVG